MSRTNCDRAGQSILSMFGNVDRIRYSVSGFTGDRKVLEDLVDTWWSNYKAWELTDTLGDAYKEQRLTAKGTSLMGLNGEKIQAYSRPADPSQRYGQEKWASETARSTPIMKTNASIQARMDPTVFVPGNDGASQKTDLGFHDLSALLLNPKADISAQQYKTPSDDQVFVFMPLSTAMDQAVFQNINTLAKLDHQTEKKFYDKVRDIRSTMTRIKLAAEHDMATKFIEVGQSQRRGGPKYKYTLSSTTDVSLRDEDSGLVNRGTVKPLVTDDRVDKALEMITPAIVPKRRKELKDALLKVLKVEKLNMISDPEAFRLELHERLFNTKRIFEYKPDWTGVKPVPTSAELEEYEKFILDKCGGKVKGSFKTTPGLLQARQTAAINFQTLVLGEILRYGEVTIAYRQHANKGAFPKFAKFDKQGRRWIVGTVNAQNNWTATEETFPDRPV